MANFSVFSSRIPSASFPNLVVYCPATLMKRIKLYDIVLGTDGTPADVANLWTITRTTTAPTGGTVATPSPLDVADAAAVSLAMTVAISGGAATTGTALLAIALNQKASFRWVAAPGSEITIPATANAGAGLFTPTVGTTVSSSQTVFFQEQ